MKENRFLLFLLSLLILSSCGLFKKAAVEDYPNLKNKNRFTAAYSRWLDDQEYEWFVASGRMKVKSEKQNLSLSLSLKSRRDSLVWLRLSKLLELARAQLDKGNFDLINRIDRSHTSFSYDEIATYVDPDQGMAAVQSLLMGNVPFDFREAEFDIDETSYILTIQDSIAQTAYLDKYTLKLLRYEIESVKEQTRAVVTFADYEQLDGGLLVPKRINVEIVGADLESITLEFSKLGFSKKEQVEFEIPDGYKKN